MAELSQLKLGATIQGTLFPEPVQILVVIPMGNSIKIIGKGLRTSQVHEPVLTLDQVSKLR